MFDNLTTGFILATILFGSESHWQPLSHQKEKKTSIKQPFEKSLIVLDQKLKMLAYTNRHSQSK